MARKYRQSKFIPKNISKYDGDATAIFARSSWERLCMIAFDENPNVVSWGSETKIIPYFWSGDGKNHRYFTDFVIVVKNKNGGLTKAIIEVKPYAQTIEPVAKKGKKRKTLEEEAKTYSKNQAKWKAAREWCRVNGYKFLILTEKDIFPNGKTY